MTRMTWRDTRDAPACKSWRHGGRWMIGLLVFGLALARGGWAEETALDRYIAKPDSNYSYRHYHTQERAAYAIYFLEMTSQQWRSASEVDRPVWTHEVALVIPRVGLDTTDTAVLVIGGGKNGGALTTDINDAVGVAALATGAVLAIVNQVPNQPLYFTDEAGIGRNIENFLVLGGSKRGWTTWLTAAVDKRVKAIIPASIDMLNLSRQFIHQWESYGADKLHDEKSALKDYMAFDLPCRVQTPEGKAMLRVVDPYTYRDRYTMPKLILNSTGDQFFTTDSSRFYYADLIGPKWLRYAPNTDHKQSEDVIIEALSWIDDILDNKTSHQITWALEGEGVLRVSPTAQPKEVKLWQATNPKARDFRLEEIGSVWTSQTLRPQADGTYLGSVQRPATGWTAFLIEVTFDTAGVIEPDQVYSTAVQIIPDTLPFAGTACGGNYRTNLESPYQGSFESGIGLIRGWVCQANTVEVQIDGGERQRVAYGTTRKDTVEVCGDDNNGFGYTYNWNVLSTGEHTLRAFADNREFANVTFNVTALGVDFLRGASGEYTLPNFPQGGDQVTVRWSEPHQNFVIAGASLNPASVQPTAASPLAASLAHLESPYPGSFESGIGLIRGWICQASTVEVQLDGGERQRVAYGTTRKDTAGVCGDDNNGFGYTFNWNALGTGIRITCKEPAANTPCRTSRRPGRT